MDDALLSALRRALVEGPPLRVAVLFGSAARGRLRPDSDVDLAILPADPELPLEAELDLQARLSRACRREVDLVRLDHAPTLLRWQVARAGIVVASDPPGEGRRFLERAIGEYLDAGPGLEAVARRYVRHLAEAENR